nr:E3 ubiquitin-protein ligase RAD18-like isoform X1 [Nerophis lumbriciformis]
MDFKMESDPPPTITCLKNVDDLLRCPICMDFLNISMMTKCSHNFCSLCIRKFFSYKLQCPVCNTQATEQDLRNNRLLDELVVGFHTVRKQLSKTFESPPISPKSPTLVKCKTPRDKSQSCKSSVISNFFQKRPRTSCAKNDKDATPLVQRRSKRTNNGNFCTDTNTMTVKEETMDAEDASFKQADMVLPSISTAEDRPRSSSSLPNNETLVIKVECPVCSVSVSQQFINKHLDMCLRSGEKKQSLRSSISKTRRPMVKLVYSLLSLQELRRRLKECHLSVHGTRDQLIKRHREFVHIYNAQCDSFNPKSAEDIAKEVVGSEKIKNQLQIQSKPVMVFAKNHSEEEIDEVHSKYRKQHSSDFSRLVAQVRGRLDTTRKTRIKEEVTAGGEGVQETPMADQGEESQSYADINMEEEVEEGKEPSARGYVLSNSPSYDDVSISSSISDIFAPDTSLNCAPETRSVKKQATCPIAASSTTVGKRLRKTRLID